MQAIPVIAVIDVGKTNKKILLFDKEYKIVYEHSVQFEETVDEDGDPCEDVDSLRLCVFDFLRAVFTNKQYDVKAINFSGYGASFVLVNKKGTAVCPLYNYLKPYPEKLQKDFYTIYGGEEGFSKLTASPVLGNLNSGMQLYRLKHLKPELFDQVEFALHLPQYLSYLLTGVASSDITSIGCHTNLWDFTRNNYHEWVSREGILPKLAPITACNVVQNSIFPGSTLKVGVGLHDSSAALIPYLAGFSEPFVLISSGTWCISLNPFNNTPLTAEQLRQDCLCYLHYKGAPVKASRLFAGSFHEEQTKRIATHFGINTDFYKKIEFDFELTARLQQKGPGDFSLRPLSEFVTEREAYHQLMIDLVHRQVESTNLVLDGCPVNRIFVDGGFSKNTVFMKLLASEYPGLEVFAASMPQASALGAAIAIHNSWNDQDIPQDLIRLTKYNALELSGI